MTPSQDGSVRHLQLRNGETLKADEYVSALPVDVLKRLLPKKWSAMPFFRHGKLMDFGGTV